MDGDILEIARREREKLLAELSKNPSFQKLQQVNRLIDTYEAVDGSPDNARAPVSRPILSGPRASSKVAAVDEAVSNHFKLTGKRASSGELLHVVQNAGIEMTGRVPSKTLSAFLTNSRKFNNLKGFGYGLAEWGENPGPNDSQTSIFN